MLALPVLRGLCKMESYKDGTLTMRDVAEMNDWLVWEADNKAAARG